MPRRAAAVVLFRRHVPAASAATDPAALEVFLVLRSPELRFLGGRLAFPGGAVEDDDARLPLAGLEQASAPERELVAGAARELFEETGLLVVTPDAGELSPAEAAAARRDAAPFRDLLERRGLRLDGSAFAPLLRLVTPPFSRQRFDTAFYLVETRGEPEIVPGELVSGAWHRPRAALEAWRRGDVKIAPPVVSILQTLASLPLEEAVRALRAVPAEFEGSGRAVPCAPGYEMLPLTTPPLPPEIPTNTLLVGERDFIVVDPAPSPRKGREHLLAAIDARLGRGDRLFAVILTHHHPDHVGCLEEVAERYRAPVWAHRRTGELLARRLDRELADGDAIELGVSPDGQPDWRLVVLFTPGHAEGHIVLHDERHRTLVAGDLVSTLVSMYVGSPGGNLREYGRSLERVARLDLETLYPAHGAPADDPRRLIEETVRHRQQRVEEVVSRLDDTPRQVEEIATEVYPAAGDKLRPLVVRATRAALEYLAEEGRAVAAGGDRFARPDGKSPGLPRGSPRT